MKTPHITPNELASMIDHTFLKGFGPGEDIDTLCAEAREYRFVSVCVHPAELGRCGELLQGTGVKLCTVAGFPLGQSTSATKVFEARNALEAGAGEIDMVINVRALQDGRHDYVRGEIAQVATACHESGGLCKVIVETCYLSAAQKRTACALVAEAGADYVKTSTGFGPAGATVEDVALMREVVGPDMGIKAAGGIRDLATALAMIEAGATRIGASAGVQIIEELRGSPRSA